MPGCQNLRPLGSIASQRLALNRLIRCVTGLLISPRLDYYKTLNLITSAVQHFDGLVLNFLNLSDQVDWSNEGEAREEAREEERSKECTWLTRGKEGKKECANIRERAREKRLACRSRGMLS